MYDLPSAPTRTMTMRSSAVQTHATGGSSSVHRNLLVEQVSVYPIEGREPCDPGVDEHRVEAAAPACG